ncbi:MAG: hypothetical protein HY286_06490 [Planctomycetes bacterium]|nr:hypothetical protein [Planctomycetota bacterium]
MSRQSARAEFQGSGDGVGIGTRCEIQIPSDRPKPTSENSTPQHDPWKAPVKPSDAENPLLAPTGKVTTPQKLDLKFDGRYYARFNQTRDMENHRTYSLARTGMDFTLNNLFHHEGAIEFSGEYYDRRSPAGGFSSDEQTGRIERFNYHSGDRPEDPLRYQIGRFIQHEFPELGLIDGAEFTFRPNATNHVGVSAGMFPKYTPDLRTGDDSEGSIYYRYLFDENDRASIGAAYQKTLHHGESDRDVVALNGHNYSMDGFMLTGSALVDIYTSKDAPKSPGPELSQLFLLASHPLGKNAGVGATISDIKIPQTLHDELPPLFAKIIQQTDIKRAGLNSWQSVSKTVRFSERADYWWDRQDNGESGDLRVDFRNVLFENGDFYTSVFGSKGTYSTRTGARAGIRQETRIGNFNIDYEFARDSYGSKFSVNDTFAEHQIRAGYDTELFKRSNLSIYVEERIIDNAAALAIGFYFSIRF